MLRTAWTCKAPKNSGCWGTQHGVQLMLSQLTKQSTERSEAALLRADWDLQGSLARLEYCVKVAHTGHTNPAGHKLYLPTPNSQDVKQDSQSLIRNYQPVSAARRQCILTSQLKIEESRTNCLQPRDRWWHKPTPPNCTTSTDSMHQVSWYHDPTHICIIIPVLQGYPVM